MLGLIIDIICQPQKLLIEICLNQIHFLCADISSQHVINNHTINTTDLLILYKLTVDVLNMFTHLNGSFPTNIA